MGHIYTDIEIINTDDLTRVTDHSISPDQVRHLKLNHVLVDTGATTLCLPADIIRKLGLTRYRTETVAIATGTTDVRTFQSVELHVGDRTATVDVMELPEGSEPLLGAVPMQLLGITLDLAKESLQFLKVGKGSGYLRI
jgi:predicted aspartyl protease